MFEPDIEKLSIDGEIKYCFYQKNNESHNQMLQELLEDESFKEVDFLYDAVRTYPYKRFYEQEKKNLEHAFFTAIANIGDYPVGILQLRYDDFGEVEAVTTVRPSERGKNIKKQMIFSICEYLNQNGIQKLSFFVHKYNVKNLKSLFGMNAENVTLKQREDGYSKFVIYTDNIIYIDKLPSSSRKK